MTKNLVLPKAAVNSAGKVASRTLAITTEVFMNYYDNLPGDYVADKVINAKKTSTGIIMNLVALLMMVVVFVIAEAFVGFDLKIDFSDFRFTIYLFIFLIVILLYLVLHELVHGLAYKIFTHKKLTFGFTWSAAFCGVPEIYVKIKPMIVTILAPFVVFSIVGIILMIILKGTLMYTFASAFLAVHIGGCVGDLYGALLMIFKYYGQEILVNDTGPTQTFYVKNKTATGDINGQQ